MTHGTTVCDQTQSLLT